MKLQILHYPTIDSTNRKAKELAQQGYEQGTCVLADDQTDGRGRLEKVWFSAAGKGLYCSLILRPQVELEKLPFTSIWIGIEVADFVESYFGTPPVALKWPNDMYLGGRKIGGILVESSPLQSGGAEYLVVGIGLNIHHARGDFPAELAHSSTSLHLELPGQSIGPIQPICSGLMSRLLENLSYFERSDKEDLLTRWRPRDMLVGKQVEMVDIEQKKISGKVLGVNENGILEVIDNHGVTHQILSGDIRLAK